MAATTGDYQKGEKSVADEMTKRILSALAQGQPVEVFLKDGSSFKGTIQNAATWTESSTPEAVFVLLRNSEDAKRIAFDDVANITGWSHASFTPNGKKELPLKDVHITFPAVTDPLDPNAPDYVNDTIVGPIGIRVEALQAGYIPTFDVGTTGTFSATLQGQLRYITNNAVVIMSDNRRLVLSATSFDDSISPHSFSRTT
jgi:hypothetical protein